MTAPLIGIAADIGAFGDSPRERSFSYLTYIDAVRQAGGVPVMLPPSESDAAAVIGRIDGLVLAGGNDCDPKLFGEEPLDSIILMDLRRQEGELALLRAARDRRLPTLGICLGMQMMNVVAGGSLIQDLRIQRSGILEHASGPDQRARHDVDIERGSRLGSVIGSGRQNVNSSHRQAVRDPGRGLRICAAAPDGVVEAIEDPALPFFIGVQWHPEDMPGEESAAKLFRALIEAAREAGSHRERPLQS